MLSYELAKQLKDNNFPFKLGRDYNISDWFWLPCDEMTKNDRKKCWIPNLSELIEVVGNRFTSLTHGTTVHLRWIAQSSFPDKIVESGWCKTPEEAVARLWLKLKDNK